jgi:hypothetical protein
VALLRLDCADLLKSRPHFLYAGRAEGSYERCFIHLVIHLAGWIWNRHIRWLDCVYTKEAMSERFWPTIASVRDLQDCLLYRGHDEILIRRWDIDTILRAYVSLVDMSTVQRNRVIAEIRRGPKVPLKGTKP